MFKHYYPLQVPLSVVITWAYAFFLTAGGAYNYRGCTTGIPSSNILNDACRRHAYTMQHCRADVSNAWRSASWVRIPYPLQWGIPIFQLRTSIIMVVTSIVASVDSVGIPASKWTQKLCKICHVIGVIQLLTTPKKCNDPGIVGGLP